MFLLRLRAVSVIDIYNKWRDRSGIKLYDALYTACKIDRFSVLDPTAEEVPETWWSSWWGTSKQNCYWGRTGIYMLVNEDVLAKQKSGVSWVGKLLEVLRALQGAAIANGDAEKDGGQIRCLIGTKRRSQLDWTLSRSRRNHQINRQKIRERIINDVLDTELIWPWEKVRGQYNRPQQMVALMHRK